MACIGKVYEQADDCKLNESVFETMNEDLSVLAEYFNITKSQALFVALVFVINYKGNVADLNDFIRHFDCNPMKMLAYSEDISLLCNARVFIRKKSKHNMKLFGVEDQFVINEKISQAIINNQPMPVLEPEGFSDVMDLLEKCYQLGEQRDDEEISTFELFSQTKELIVENLHFPLIKRIHDFGLSIEDTYLYIYLIWKTITGQERVDVGRAAAGIFDRPTKRIRYVQKLISKENALVDQQHIEVVEANFFNDSEIRLSESSVKMLEEFGINLFASKKQKKNHVIEPADIKPKTLYFSDFEHQQLDLLHTVLQDEHFRETQHRLDLKGLPKGITVLLHGSPGTGKTETVFQVSKATNREIVKVDISQSKSMWFGESEKIIKRIFTDYKAFANECDRMPILLFNEADAIISKRNTHGTGAVAQTENAIQNILLEELENFEGIFFATTNLVGNLDLAFERRFLFKIEFQKPEASIKAKIWHSKLPALSASECEMLANQFDFSGGQIDNIVRKNEIHEIIHGVSVDFANIVNFCKTELLSQNHTVKIGFTKN